MEILNVKNKESCSSLALSRDGSIANPAYQIDDSDGSYEIPTNMSTKGSCEQGEPSEYTDLDSGTTSARNAYESLRRDDHTYQEVSDVKSTYQVLPY